MISLRRLYQVTRTRRLSGLSYWYLLLSLLTIILAVGLFNELAEEVGESQALVFDRVILDWVQSFRAPQLNSFISLATDIGGLIGVGSLTLVLGASLAYRHRWLAVEQLIIGVIGAALINLGLKLLFVRERPDVLLRLIEENSYSFPSGHAMASSALALSIILITWRTRWRWAVVGLAASYGLFVGLSRVYLGVHYPTDILAGWLVSAVWVIVVAIVLGVLGFRRSRNFKENE